MSVPKPSSKSESLTRIRLLEEKAADLGDVVAKVAFVFGVGGLAMTLVNAVGGLTHPGSYSAFSRAGSIWGIFAMLQILVFPAPAFLLAGVALLAGSRRIGMMVVAILGSAVSFFGYFAMMIWLYGPDFILDLFPHPQ
jgi:hypothetical protein